MRVPLRTDADAAILADDPSMTLGTEIRHLDDIAAGLRAMANHAVAYDDVTVRWLADEIERAADRSQLVADLEAALALTR